MADPRCLLDRILAALKSLDDVTLLHIYDSLCARLSSCRLLKLKEHFALVDTSLFRDVGAEIVFISVSVYLPNHVKTDKTKPSVALR